MNDIHAAFNIIEKLAAVSATPGINEDTLKMTNELIQKLLNSVVRKERIRLDS